jgi:hypothetical protein
MNSKKKWIITAFFFTVLLVAALWIFEGRHMYERWSGERQWTASLASAPECVYAWENVRKLQTVRRPGTAAADNKWYTAVYYEQVYDQNNREKFIALYDGRNPALNTCAQKLTGRYGTANIYDPQTPPIAMTIYEGDFVLQTTDDPNGGVALEKLPLLFGPLPPKVTRK